MLLTQAQVVVDVLRSGGESGYSPLAAVTATRALSTLVDDILHTLVLQAKDEGHTWAEVGDVLHTTRQAAYQRFGSGRGKDNEEIPMTELTTADAIERAQKLFVLNTEEKFDEMRVDFNERMLAGLSAGLLEMTWSQITGAMGEFKSFGEPVARTMGDTVVVDIPMQFREGPMKGRVAYGPDGKIAGLFLLNPDVL